MYFAEIAVFCNVTICYTRRRYFFVSQFDIKTRQRESVPNSLNKIFKSRCTIQYNKDKFQSKAKEIYFKVVKNTPKNLKVPKSIQKY